MFWNIFKPELIRNFKSPALYVFTAILFFTTFMFLKNTQPGHSMLYVTITKEWHNAPIIIARLMAGFSLIGVLITMVLIGRTVARDFPVKIHDFYFTSPLSKSVYLLGRFFGGYAANLLIFTGIILGSLLATLALDPQYVGPFRLSSYVLPLIVIVLPNVFFAGSVFFATATLTRNMVMTYISGVAFFMIYALASISVAKMDNEFLQIMMDPFGIAAMNTLTKYWTTADLNHNLMPLDSYFLLNRALWLMISAGLMVFTMKKFGFVSVLEKKSKKSQSVLTNGEHRIIHVLEPLRIPSLSFAWFSRLRNFFRLTGVESKRILWHPAFLILTFMAVAEMITNFLGNIAEEGFEIYPFTYKFLSYSEHIWFYMIPLAILFTGALVWRERDHNTHEICDTLPVPEWMSYLSKLAAMIGVQFIYILLAVIAGILIQITVFDFTTIEPSLYVKGMFGILFMNFFFLTVLFVFIQSLVPNKYLGFFIAAAYFLGDLFIFDTFKSDQMLLRYGYLPPYIYSDLNGYGHYAPVIIWYTVYWILGALFLIMLTSLIWRRGNEIHLKYRLKWASRKIRATQGALLGLILIAFLSTGFYIHYNRSVINPFISKDDLKAMKASYEKKFGVYENKPQPGTVHVGLNVDLYPEDRKININGHYLLKNQTSNEIPEIYLNLSDLYITDVRRLELTPKAELVSKADEFGFRIYRLGKPMNPGDTIRLDFDLEARAEGFTDNMSKDEIAQNGTCVIFSASENYKYFPGVGFLREILLSKDQERLEHGLQPRPKSPPADKADRSVPIFRTNLITYDGVISTSSDQVIVSNGELVREWTENNRRYFHFRPDTLIHDELIIASGKYVTTKDKHTGVDIEVYYDQKHDFNINRIIGGVKSGLDFCGNAFSTYPYKILRVVEVPAYMKEGGARSQPTVFIWNEGAGFIRDLRDSTRVDDVFGIAAHELGHQWWAYIVNAVNAEGSEVLSETICQYIWLMCLEKEYGAAMTRKYLKREMDHYLRARKRDVIGERPLVNGYFGQSYLAYQKSSVVMYALQDYIGADNVNKALKKIQEKYAWRRDTFATAAELVTEIKSVTPDSMKYLVTDMFEKITLYDNKINSATCNAFPGDQYMVTMKVVTEKFYADSAGNLTDAPLNDYVYIGVIGENEKILYLKKHKITGRETEITVIVDEKPNKAGIDPFLILIDRNRDDNMMSIGKIL